MARDSRPVREDDWDNETGIGHQSGPKVQKIRKEKRSVRGRTIDDWIVDVPKQKDKKLFMKALQPFIKKEMLLARVIEVHKRHIFIAEESPEAGYPDTGQLWLCTVARRHFQRAHKERNFVAVGDRVLFRPGDDTEFDSAGVPISNLPRGVIEHALTRTNRLTRRDPLRVDWEHTMLTNIDRIVIVASVLNPKVRWGLIDRILVQAELESIETILVLNKVDLLADKTIASQEFIDTYNRHIAIYRSIGYEVIEISALHPENHCQAVQRVKEIFTGCVTGLCGHSGVGKSSVVNLLSPEVIQLVDENPEIFYKGRHTTTYNTFLSLGVGGFAIDTPGVRSFDTKVDDPITLTWCFREMRVHRCRYRGCTHEHEDGCGIKSAVEQGAVTQERYRSFLGILKGISFREGDGDDTDALLKADLKARATWRDRHIDVDDPEGIEQ